MLPLISIPNSALALSAMCLGTGAFGTGVPVETTDRVYEAFRAAGGNCFDTAHCYCFWLPGGQGSSERALGDCIRRHGDLGKVNIITKGGHPGQEGYPRPDRYMSPELIARDIEESLQRLGVETVDLYFLHRDDSRMPVDEILDMLHIHLNAGRLRAIGVSNWSTARIAAANEWAAAQGKQGFVVSQPEFNLAQSNAPQPAADPTVRYLSAADIAWHAATSFPVMAYSPTAGGYFASLGERAVTVYENPVSRGRLQRVAELAHRLGVSPNQVALSWLVQQPFTTIPILGTASVEHLADALGAAGGILTAEQVRWLSS